MTLRRSREGQRPTGPGLGTQKHRRGETRWPGSRIGGAVASHGTSHRALRLRSSRQASASRRRSGRRPTGPSSRLAGQPGAIRRARVGGLRVVAAALLRHGVHENGTEHGDRVAQAPGEPGTFTTRVWPACPARPRESMAVGTPRPRPSARSASSMPGTRRSITRRWPPGCGRSARARCRRWSAPRRSRPAPLPAGRARRAAVVHDVRPVDLEPEPGQPLDEQGAAPVGVDAVGRRFDATTTSARGVLMPGSSRRRLAAGLASTRTSVSTRAFSTALTMSIRSARRP